MSTPVATLDAPVAGTGAAYGWRALARHWLVLSQLALALLVVYAYELEGPAFARVAQIAAGGFAISLLLPIAWRLQYFALLSMVGVLAVAGPTDTAWVLALGLSLIGVCHLPIRLAYRVAAIAVLAGALALVRAGVAASPWPATVWAVLGSMFMFRLVLYLKAIGDKPAERSWWGALSYFFMLPNVAFPLFPVVDYQTFRRTHFDRDERAIYETGMLWISRGLMQLVLYRLVYYVVLNNPADVTTLFDLFRYMLGTVLLYLRVSGQFHVIVGILHLFGFRLPETHKLYYLAHSVMELWRRMNVYWTDFMMKVVFYPLYFRLKKLGPALAVGLATVVVFVTTWLLHSYQWFWLRGGFPITAPDVLFWGILGVLVVRGALRELKAAKTRRRASGWSWKQGLRAGATFFLLCFLWSLWSATSLMQWLWMLGAAGNVDAAGIALVLGTLALIVGLGGLDWESADGAAPERLRGFWTPALRTFAPLVLLLVLAHPVWQTMVSGDMSDTLASLQKTGLNAQDAATRHRGYYEQLDVRSQLNVADAAGDADRQAWMTPAQAGVIRELGGLLSRDLYPSKRVAWNGMTFSTNSWGMRDREYSLDKPPGTLRIALLGPSHVMGNGVGDGETFEAIVEDRLNREFRHDRFGRVEILNFGVDGQPLPEQLALLTDRVLRFSPDIVIFTHHHRAQLSTERYLLKIAWNGAPIGDGEFRALLERAGLADIDRGRIPVPFAAWRTQARRLGVDPRMPDSEADARAHAIAEAVNDWAIGEIAAQARRHHATAVMLSLDAVIDDTPMATPNEDAIRGAGVPVLDLFGIFPADQRAALRAAPWDEHPNAAGHRLIADRMYDQLVPLLHQLYPSGDVRPAVAAVE